MASCSGVLSMEIPQASVEIKETNSQEFIKTITSNLFYDIKKIMLKRNS